MYRKFGGSWGTMYINTWYSLFTLPLVRYSVKIKLIQYSWLWAVRRSQGAAAAGRAHAQRAPRLPRAHQPRLRPRRPLQAGGLPQYREPRCWMWTTCARYFTYTPISLPLQSLIRIEREIRIGNAFTLSSVQITRGTLSNIDSSVVSL